MASPRSESMWHNARGRLFAPRPRKLLAYGCLARCGAAARRVPYPRPGDPAGRIPRPLGRIHPPPDPAPSDNGTPAARPVRKATGLSETAGLPKKAVSGSYGTPIPQEKTP